MTPSLTTHLSRLKQLAADLQNSAYLLADLSTLPPGAGDAAEASALLVALEALDVRHDGSGKDPTESAGVTMEAALRDGAYQSGRNLQRVAYTLLNRLDRLARHGVRAGDCLLPQDFGDQLVFLVNEECPTKPPKAFGVYAALADDHPLRRRLKEEDCYQFEGKGLVALGQAVTSDSQFGPMAFLPLSLAVRLTLSLSAPQKQARAAFLAQEEGERLARLAAVEAAKTPRERALEARLAELEDEVREMKKGPAEAQ